MVQLSIEEQLLYRNAQFLRGGLIFKVHILVYHSTLDVTVTTQKKKKKKKKKKRKKKPQHRGLRKYSPA